MRKKHRRKQKHQKKQNYITGKGIAKVAFLAIATLIIVIAGIGFIAFRDSSSYPKEPLYPSPTISRTKEREQVVITNTPSPKIQKNQYSEIAYQVLDNFPPSHCLSSLQDRSFSDGIIIRTEQEYQELSSGFKANGEPYCKRFSLPTIDFNTNILFIKNTLYDCARVIHTDFYQDDKNKKIIYYATTTEVHRYCQFDTWNYLYEAVVLPKLPDYTVEFIVENKPSKITPYKRMCGMKLCPD